jgi:hypothetical protein
MSRFQNFMRSQYAWLAGSGSRPSTREWAVVFLLLVVCLVFNMKTCRLYPAEWSDEVSFSEPSVNFAQSGSFTTRVWPYQPLNTFPVTNCPFYSMSLAVWLSLVGTSLLAVRTFNYALGGGVAFLSWACSWKLGLLKRPASRLGLVLLMESGYGVSSAIRSSRPDMLAAFLLFLLVLLFGIGHSRWRTAAMIFVAAVIVWTALQVALAAAFAAFVAWLFFRQVSFKDLVVAALGMMLGALLLILFLEWHQVLPYFIISISSVTDRGSLSDPSFFHAIRETISKCINNYIHDFSILPLFIGTIFCLAIRQRQPARLSRPVLFLVLLIFSLPLLLNVFGHFTFFYSYLIFLPACLLFLHLHEEAWESAGALSRRWLGVSFILITGLSLAVGLPLRIALAGMFFSVSNDGQMSGVLRQHIHAGDIVFTDNQAFFDAKQIATVVYVPDQSAAWNSQKYSKRELGMDERNSVSVLIVKPEMANDVSGWLGGKWELAGQPFGDSMHFDRGVSLPGVGKLLASYCSQATTLRYPLEILRRKNETTVHQ